MSFTQETFATIGSQSSDSPKVYSYSSSDVLAVVMGAGYFTAKRFQLSEGDWIMAVLGDGNALLKVNADLISASDAAVSSLPSDNFSGGFFDYNDLATASTPIVVTGGGGFVKLTNDEAGPQTLKTFAPNGVTDVWDAANDEFDWSDLSLGDMVDIRVDLLVTTSSPNQTVDVRLFLAVGGSEYSIPFEEAFVKTSGANVINRYNGIYLGDTNTLNNPGEFRIASDGNATVIVNGWYCKVIKQGG